jgi:diaminohydroxyphosphoribosylaminopyrimidine deaminase/5-amino-6-(5-phosphoribosylamino)uracil reductase
MQISVSHAMQRALALAERGWGRVHPNPLVGAVVLRDGAVAGEGWHAEYGETHAERMALAAAGPAARGAVLVCTLEPCTHHGQQPPCVDAIFAAGVVRVVAAMRDPNPEAAGGLERLRAGGLMVESGVLEGEARRLNARFLHALAGQPRPYVAVKLAVTLDGLIADRQGNSHWISGEAAREWVHRERAGYHAVGAGAATVVADNARLTVRGRITPRIPPVRVVFDRSARLRADHAIFADATKVPVHVVHPRGAIPVVGELDGVTLVPADTLPEALAALKSMGIDSMLVEGGGRIAGAMLGEGLVDRVYQVQAPVWLGAGRPAWSGVRDRDLDTAIRWRIVDRRPLGEDTLLTVEP